jgi:hypothetical protein
MGEQAVVVDERNEIEQDLLRLRDLQAQEGIEAARAFAAELAAKWPDSEAVQHQARVLAPPRVVGWSPGSGRLLSAERAWLRAHAKEYPGCWLAVKGERLVAADPDPRVVMDAVDREGLENALIHFQPDPSQWT